MGLLLVCTLEYSPFAQLLSLPPLMGYKRTRLISTNTWQLFDLLCKYVIILVPRWKAVFPVFIWKLNFCTSLSVFPFLFGVSDHRLPTGHTGSYTIETLILSWQETKTCRRSRGVCNKRPSANITLISAQMKYVCFRKCHIIFPSFFRFFSLTFEPWRSHIYLVLSSRRLSLYHEQLSLN